MKVIQIIILIAWMHFESIQGLNYKIPNPCPVKLGSPVVDMCMSSIAKEEFGNGPEYLDSVVLRAMVDRGDCTCDIVIENHVLQTGIFIEKYSNMSTAAPENNSCGLAIDIEMLNDESEYNPIECTSGVDRRPFSIVKNDVLRLTSRIIQGNFTRGYCMHIIRDDLTDKIPQRLKIVCNESVVFQHESSSISPIENKPETKDDDKLFVAIGICAGVLVVIGIVIIVIIITRRRRSNKRLDAPQRNIVPDSNAANEDPQYDGLKDNVLYVSATQHQDIDIHYSTVDSEGQQMTSRRSEINNHYNTVEINAETRSLQTLQTFHDNEAITDNETSKASNETKNLSPLNECSVVYAVVDKGLRNLIHNTSVKIQDDANSKQAYDAIVDKIRNENP